MCLYTARVWKQLYGCLCTPTDPKSCFTLKPLPRCPREYLGYILLWMRSQVAVLSHKNRSTALLIVETVKSAFPAAFSCSSGLHFSKICHL